MTNSPLQQAREDQKELLTQLKCLNADLARLRPLVQSERDSNKLLGTTVAPFASQYRVAKDTQLGVLVRLKEVNADLKRLRPLEVPTTKVRKDMSAEKAAKVAQREAAKQAKAQIKTAEQQAKQAAKDAERERLKEERDARREDRRIELELQNKPARGYNIPLLTDKERENTNFLMKNVFSKHPKAAVVAGPGV
jgi:phenylalanyl-tRNA synthetase alpha subunit